MIPDGAVRVRIVGVRGSAPRGVGAEMWVWPDPGAPAVPWSGGLARGAIWGTIGGGALEAEAIGRALGCTARAVIALPLGPALGQCCGGAVEVELCPGAVPEARVGLPVWIWGAGHVGRALAGVLAPLARFAVTAIDTHASRLEGMAPGVRTVVAAEPARLMARAPQDARHYVMTYSHEIDLSLCHAGLLRGFGGLGLIGSASKWARFRARLAALGHGAEAVARITCPIGDPRLGKEPQAIAIGVAQALVLARGTGESDG